MLSRLETMFLMGMEMPLSAIKGQIASGIDIIVHLGRIRDRSRKVLEIVEIVGIREGEIQINPLYKFKEENIKDYKMVKGKLLWSDSGLNNIGKLINSGFKEEAFKYGKRDKL